MRIGLHDADAAAVRNKTFPNYALMKLAAWHKQQGNRVEWWQPLGRYDAVYSSKVFSYTPENPYLPVDAIRGGTGYDIKGKLPKAVDDMFPEHAICYWIYHKGLPESLPLVHRSRKRRRHSSLSPVE